MAINETLTKYPYVAILFHKSSVKEGVAIFIPYCAVNGNYNEDTEVFSNYLGDPYFSIEKSHYYRGNVIAQLPDGKQICKVIFFGFLTSLEELKERYNTSDEEQALKQYYSEFDGNIYFGLDKGKSKLEIRSLSLDGIINVGPEEENVELGIKQYVITPLKKQNNEGDSYNKR